MLKTLSFFALGYIAAPYIDRIWEKNFSNKKDSKPHSDSEEKKVNAEEVLNNTVDDIHAEEDSIANSSGIEDNSSISSEENKEKSPDESKSVVDEWLPL